MSKNIVLSEIQNAVENALVSVTPLIKEVSENPETGFQETFAAALQKDYLQKLGFGIKSPVGNLETAFRGDWQQCEGENTVALLTEYDALPEPLNHACGHQLIMGVGLLAATAVQSLMKKYHIPGTLSVLGCPGEEQQGGKLCMLNDGTFNNVDIALLSHPFFRNGVTKNVLAVSRFDVEFCGVSAHASTAPQQGINALDAMTIFINGLNAWRQQLPDTARVHGIITNGGTAANVIPDYTAGFYYVRSNNNELQKSLELRFQQIVQGAALITGCQYKVTRQDNFYSAGKPDAALTAAGENIMTAVNMHPQLNIKEPLSTDFANVCDKIPGVNIYFDVTAGKPLALHSVDFRTAAAAPEALPNTCHAAVVLSKLALDYFTDPDFRNQVGINTIGD